MQYIKSKLFELVALSIIIALLSLFISHTKFKVVFKKLGGLLLLLCIVSSISPIIEIISNADLSISDGSNDIDNDPASDDILFNAVGGELCNEISILISERFSIDRNNYEVFITLDTQDIESIRLTAVMIKFKTQIDEAIADKIAEYISDTTASNCTVLLSD